MPQPRAFDLVARHHDMVGGPRRCRAPAGRELTELSLPSSPRRSGRRRSGARHRRREPARDPRSSTGATLLPRTTSGTPGVISFCQLREGGCTSMPWQALCRRMRTVAPYLENARLRLRRRPGREPAADRHGARPRRHPLVVDRGTRADATGAIRALVRVRRRRCARCARIRDRAPRCEARGPMVAPSWCDRL